MSAPTQAAELRDKLAAYEDERTLRLLYRMRGQDPGAPSPEQRRRVGWLLGDGAAEALVEAEQRGDLVGAEAAATRAQLAVLAVRSLVVEAQAELREALTAPLSEQSGEWPLGLIAGLGRTDDGKRRAELGRQVLSALQAPTMRLVAAYDEARERFPLAFGEPSDALRRSALQLLDATEDATRERVRDQLRPFERARQLPWHALYRGLRAREHDPLCRPRGRFRRVAAAPAALGFERHMGRCLRVEPAPLPIPHSKVIGRAVPGDIRIVHPEHTGLLYELSAYEGLGRAFGWSLTGAATPWALARPVAGGPSPVLGGLMLGWAADPLYLGSLQGLSGTTRARMAADAGLLVALCARWAACRIAEPEQGRSVSERLEWRAGLLSRALCCEVPPVVAGLLWPGHRSALSEAFGRLLGLSLHVGLRERFDEDCFRNPRTAESLRELAEPGGCSDPEGFVAALGVDDRAAAKRALELLER